MTIALIVSSVLLWLLLVFVAFVLLGSLRAMALMRWRMAQLEATTPSRLGRNGLRPGKKAPVFRLPSVVGAEAAPRGLLRAQGPPGFCADRLRTLQRRGS